jgi:hypothetical protein
MLSVDAKIDTGAVSAVLHTSKVHTEKKGDEDWLVFSPFDHPEIVIKTQDFFTKRVRSSNGQVQTRYFIYTKIVLKKKTFPIVASLTNRSTMRYQMLIGRRFLQEQGILVDLNVNNE